MSTGNGRAAPVRALIYCDSAIASGSEDLVTGIVRSLAGRSSLQLTCFAPPENERLYSDMTAAVGPSAVRPVPAQPLRVAAMHLYDPRRLSAIRRSLGADRWDVGLFNLGSAEYGSSPLLLREPPWKRTIGFVHVVGGFRENDFRLARMRERLARRSLRALDVACVYPESAVRRFQANWRPRPETRVMAVPQSPRQVSALPREVARRRLGLGEGPLLGLAGRISFKQKGIDTFIDAASALAARPSLRFAVAGRGPDEERLRREIRRRGLEDRFQLLGHVERIEEFLCSLDAIAIPSRFEGRPLVAMEALALGVPGVASSCDGLDDIWPAEWQVPPGDAAALGERIARLLDLSEAERELVGEVARGAVSEIAPADFGGVWERILLEEAERPLSPREPAAPEAG